MKKTLCAAILSAAMVLSGATAFAQEMGKHTMDGEVTKVDAKKGWVDVKTSEGSMKLHFPSSALEGLKKGDKVTVDLGMKTMPKAASEPKAMKK